MKILILGSAGQIGRYLTKFISHLGHEVHEWDIVYSEEQDLRVRQDGFIRALVNCDFCFYLASDVGGAKYLEKAQSSFQFIYNNMAMMNNVFSALKETKKPFLFTSSQMAELSFSTYGQLKLLGEKMAKDIGGLPVRLWNVYGAEPTSEKSHVISDFCNMAKAGKDIVLRTDGLESRQMLYVIDCADAFVTLMNNYAYLDKSQNYHITTFHWVTIREIAEIVSRISGCKVVPGARKDATQANAMNNADPYILNWWRPVTSLEEGILKVYNES